jgi:hypothetical protein
MQEINLLVEQKNGTIGGNFEELKTALKAELEVYKNMVFTEEAKPEARKAVANLRKLKKSMNDKKLEVKKNFMVPYTDFEAQVKELDKLIDEPINFISGQIEEFERKRVEERKKLISDIYTEIITEHDTVAEYLPLQRIYDSKWENSTTTRKTIKEGIMKHVEHVEKDLATIRSMESEFEDKGIAKYKTTLELSDALTTMNQYQKQKEDILRRQEEEARRAAEEEKRKAEDEVHKAAEGEQKADTPVQEEPIAQETVKEEKFIEPKPVTNTVVYEIVADPFQIVQLEAFMRENDVDFKRTR